MSTRASTLDWYGCATFRLRTAEGLTVWLDAYLDRVPDAEQSGVTVDDVTAADWILVGHSHFDHLWGAERIAARTGATVVGSYAVRKSAPAMLKNAFGVTLPPLYSNTPISRLITECVVGSSVYEPGVCSSPP